MVWPNEVALLWPASVASEKAAASVRRLQAHPWVVPQICGWLLQEN